MDSSNRVYITGCSALTASGATADQTWDAILNGRHGLDVIKEWDLSGWSSCLGGELKNFQPSKLLPDRKLIKVISRQDVIGINAAIQAIEHSGLISYRDTLVDPIPFNDKTAIFVGSPGNKYFQQYDFLPLLAKTAANMTAFAKQLFNEVHPTWLLRILPNNVLAYTGILYGFKGINHNITNHAVGGMQAIIEAYHAIHTGQAERAVVIAYDIGTDPQALFYYNKLGVISERHLKPFDHQHDGTILAEGAAALVLESEACAKSRGAACYGEICGGMSASEGSGLFSIETEGSQLARLIHDTLQKLDVSPAAVDFIVAHGNGNPKSDHSEAQAITSVFTEQEVPVTAFKWSMGHTLTASGLLDTVLATYALATNCIPGIANLDKPALECNSLSLNPGHRGITTSGRHALIINRGFASMNACLVVKASG